MLGVVCVFTRPWRGLVVGRTGGALSPLKLNSHAPISGNLWKKSFHALSALTGSYCAPGSTGGGTRGERREAWILTLSKRTREHA